MTKTEARNTIISEANKRRPDHLDPFSSRHIDQAVHKLRNLDVVSKDSALVEAFGRLGIQTRGPNFRSKHPKQAV